LHIFASQSASATRPDETKAEWWDWRYFYMEIQAGSCAIARDFEYYQDRYFLIRHL